MKQVDSPVVFCHNDMQEGIVLKFKIISLNFNFVMCKFDVYINIYNIYGVIVHSHTSNMDQEERPWYKSCWNL